MVKLYDTMYRTATGVRMDNLVDRRTDTRI